MMKFLIFINRYVQLSLRSIERKGLFKRGLFECKSGVSAVEFAIIAPIMLIFVFAILNFGIYYYYSSIVENSAFAVSRSIMNTSKRPADLAAVKRMFNEEMNQLMIADIGDKPIILSVNPITASAPSLTSKPISEYNFTSGAPLIIRVIYPRPELIKVDFLVEAWPKIFGQNVDISIMVEPK
jgi:Flp pilus assembly protein TadG